MSFFKNNKNFLGFALIMIMFFVSILTSCAKDPILAYFTDGTSAGSDKYTVNVDYDEDSRFEDKYVDVLIRSNIENLTFLFKREFDEDVELFIAEKNHWHSITALLNEQKDQKEEFEKFKGKSDDTLVIKSEQNAVITLKVVVGDLKENSQGKKILINQKDVSKKFKLDLDKNLK